MKRRTTSTQVATKALTHAQWMALPLEKRIARTERLLARPAPAPFARLPEYTGPNYAGKVNMLMSLAGRIARGALNDGMLGVCLMADDWRREQRQFDEMRELVLELQDLDPPSVRRLLADARKAVLK